MTCQAFPFKRNLFFLDVLAYGPRQANLVLIAYASSERFRRACASAQSRQNLRCSLIQTVSQEEPSDRKPDPWLLWMAGHAQLKFVMTECSKTQIRLTGLIYCSQYSQEGEVSSGNACELHVNKQRNFSRGKHGYHEPVPSSSCLRPVFETSFVQNAIQTISSKLRNIRTPNGLLPIHLNLNNVFYHKIMRPKVADVIIEF